MQVEPWQIPILVMAGIVVPVSILWGIEWLRSGPSLPPPPPNNSHGKSEGGHESNGSVRNREAFEAGRALIFATLTVALSVIFFVVLGEEAASTVTAAVTAVSALVPAVLTVHSLILLRILQRGRGQDHGDA
jgi:hypothetical protein